MTEAKDTGPMTETEHVPFRTGEIVTVERTLLSELTRVPIFQRMGPGPVAVKGDVAWLGGYLIEQNGEMVGGWAVVERHEPLPDWADAPAVEVTYRDGSTSVYRGPTVFVSAWQDRLKGDVASLRGLYYRDEF